jgi:hypothetical protein
MVQFVASADSFAPFGTDVPTDVGSRLDRELDSQLKPGKVDLSFFRPAQRDRLRA